MPPHIHVFHTVHYRGIIPSVKSAVNCNKRFGYRKHGHLSCLNVAHKYYKMDSQNRKKSRGMTAGHNNRERRSGYVNGI